MRHQESVWFWDGRAELRTISTASDLLGVVLGVICGFLDTVLLLSTYDMASSILN